MLVRDQFISDAISSLCEVSGEVTVQLSNELVHLLSDQLYQSPLKAVEELVVNAYDAEAKVCRVFAPSIDDQSRRYIAVFDDGIGMSGQGLVDLWHIGRSNKRSEEIALRSKRKQIGKFGIGKLATYVIANRVTHITNSDEGILAVTLDFSDFQGSAIGADQRLILPIRRLASAGDLVRDTAFRELCGAAHVDCDALLRATNKSWTMVVLEDLKPKASKIRIGRLNWVLQTAMPLSSDFRLFLNGQRVTSSKEAYGIDVAFGLDQLPQRRLQSLERTTGCAWQVLGDSLISDAFPTGVSGRAIVTKRSLLSGKSLDIGRSHGFFVRVRGRLVNQDDDSFGVMAKSYQTFNHFRADVSADDLDDLLTASRESVELSTRREQFTILLTEIFNEARARYEAHLEALQAKDKPKKEEERNFVNPRLVEYPIADVLAVQGSNQTGAEADGSWFYLDIDDSADLKETIHALYTEGTSTRQRRRYRYEYTRAGGSGRMVKFDPVSSIFWMNEDHEVVRAHSDDGRAKGLLEDVVTAEALLEIYLRESRVPAHVVGEVLERRDALLRSLARDRPYSLSLLSAALQDAASDQYDLEIALVAAARALGFVAKHVSGSGEPDGLARVSTYPGGESKIILEAKSSDDVPSLGAIDFAGLHRHMQAYGAQGCLLVAPTYPGASREDDSAAAICAKQQGVSCWTVNQLARVVGEAEARHITAHDVLNIVLSSFTPDEVATAVGRLLAKPNGNRRELYGAVLGALRDLEGKMRDKPRTVDMIAALVVMKPGFDDFEADDIAQAIRALAAASQGGLIVRQDLVITQASIAELERRVNGLTGTAGEPRRKGSFREQASLWSESI